jgi:very-short-patch-repair endonuclease
MDATARALRRDPAPAEQKLWQALRGARLDGLQFRRQHPLSPFILDFCCSAHRLVVEVDGGVHAEQTEYDADRTQHLERYGYRVLRVRNDEVLTNLPSVLEQIKSAVLSR